METHVNAARHQTLGVFVEKYHIFLLSFIKFFATRPEYMYFHARDVQQPREVS